MIIRIVKMSFQPEKVKEFLKVFNSSKERIRKMSGCTHLELLKDVNSPTLFFTYSHWETEADLDNYRNSELFREVWANTKILFSEKAQAWSVEQKALLN